MSVSIDVDRQRQQTSAGRDASTSGPLGNPKRLRNPMATVSLSRSPVNRSPSPATLPSALSAVQWAALGVAARKPATASRGELAPGEHRIDATVRVSGTITVGHDSDTAATVTPSADVLLGLVLAKLNAVTRDSILRELPRDFAAAGAEYPSVPDEIIEATEGLTASLRRKVTQKRRGAVSGTLSAELVPSLDRRAPAAAPAAAPRRLRIAR
jgi:hypothetical protein